MSTRTVNPGKPSVLFFALLTLWLFIGLSSCNPLNNQPPEEFGNGLLISEFSADNTRYNVDGKMVPATWIELYNSGQSPVNLADISIRVYDQSSMGASNPVDFGGFTSRIVHPGEYVVVRNRVHSQDYPGDENIFTPNNLAPSFYWISSGFLELSHRGEIIDLVKFGENEIAAVSSAHWNGDGLIYESYPGEPYSGFSMARVADMTDSNRQSDWCYSEWATPGGANDVFSQTDADGDGIPDANELPGTTYLGMPLHDWGARQGVMDIFVHVSYMVGDTPSDFPGLFPRPEALEKVQQAFANQTADGRNFAVHFDVGDTSAYSQLVHPDIERYNLDGKSHALPWSQTIGWSIHYDGDVDFFQLKADFLPVNKRQIFHFMVMGNDSPYFGGLGERPGNDFLVIPPSHIDPFESEEWRLYTVNRQADVIMHELGHNLGLGHGGDESENYKPNYISIMNYMYSGMPLIGDDYEGDRYYYYQHSRVFNYEQSNPYATLYYGGAFYTRDLTRSVYSTDYAIDFSDGSSADIHEGSIDESNGLGRTGSVWVDFNGNGIVDSALAMDLNPTDDHDSGNPVLTDHNDWEAISSAFSRQTVGIFQGIATRSTHSNAGFNPLVDDFQNFTICRFPPHQHDPFRGAAGE